MDLVEVGAPAEGFALPPAHEGRIPGEKDAKIMQIRKLVKGGGRESAAFLVPVFREL